MPLIRNRRVWVRTFLLTGFAGLTLTMLFASTDGAQTEQAQRRKGAATASAAPVAKGKWTPEDVVYQEDAGSFDISKDGRSAVWVKSTADKEKNERVGNLYLSSLTEQKEVQLTRGMDQVSQPRWSPSGT